MEFKKFFKNIFGIKSELEVKKEAPLQPSYLLGSNYVDTTNSVESKLIKPNKKTTKKDQVRRHLLFYGNITSWQAIQLYGATRLSAIIFKLKEEGLIILSEPRTALDRNKNVCNYTTYVMLKGEKK